MFSFKKSNDQHSGVSRFFIGVHISSVTRKLETAIIECNSACSGSSLTLLKSVSFDLPNELAEFYEETLEVIRAEQDVDFVKRHSSGEFSELEQFFPKLSSSKVGKKNKDVSTLARLSLLRTMTTTIQKEAVSELVADSDVTPNKIIAITVNDPGINLISDSDRSSLRYYSLSDGAALAKHTGTTVISSLLPNEWSPKDQECSVLSFPYWILLSDPVKARLVIDLGETARWTYLPSSKTSTSWKDMLFHEVVPCGSLLNLFTSEATKGKSFVDVGGRLSVQGQCPNELLEFWGGFQRQTIGNHELPPRYYTPSNASVLNEIFYYNSLKSAPQKFSALDALCGSVYWIAEQIKSSVEYYEPLFKEPFDVILTGGAKQNGLLFSRLSDLFKPGEFRQLTEYGFLEDSFDAVAVAVLGALFSTGTPVPLPNNSSKSDCFWGEISPGTQEAWTRFLTFASGKSDI